MNEWKPGDKIPRQAFVIILHNAKTYEIIVDIDHQCIVSYRHVPGVQAAVFGAEYVSNNNTFHGFLSMQSIQE